MLSYSEFLQAFYPKGESNYSQEAYTVEVTVNDLMRNLTSYPIDVPQIKDGHSEASSQLAVASANLRGLQFTGNPNSNKDVAPRLKSLGFTIPVTEKGNISLTREWFDSNTGRSPFIDGVAHWRKLSKKVSTYESILKNCSGNRISTTWRTCSLEGSGRFVGEAYPILQLPLDLKKALTAPQNTAWIEFYKPNAALTMLAKLSQDPILLADLAVPDGIALRLGVPPSMVSSMFTGGLDDLLVSKQYLVLDSYMNTKLLELESGVVSLDLMDRSRKISGADRVLQMMHTLTDHNVVFETKKLIVGLLKEFPFLASSLWIPDIDRVSLTVDLPQVSQFSEREGYQVTVLGPQLR